MPPTAFITGATEGIGRAIAFAMGRAGYRVGVCARTASKVDRLLADLAAENIAAAGRPCDVGLEEEVRHAVRHVTTALGPIDTLVNNAGVLILKPVDQLTLEDWDATMTTNVKGMFLVTREVLPAMRERATGAIVNIASLAGKNGFVGGSAYAASKHAVLGFSKSLMLEVRKHGIRVIAICPGSVDTSMIQGQALVATNPDRILKPEDVAQTVLDALRLPARAMVSELDVRPTNP